MGNPMTPAMDQDMSGMGAGDDQMAQSTGPVTNNQKASERMRLDESEWQLSIGTQLSDC